MDLSRVSIGVKTFLRDDCLVKAVNGIVRTMPECKIIIADDGNISAWKHEWYKHLASLGHTILTPSFDSGFGKKSNMIADVLNTQYLLVASDDFDFDPPEVRKGIEDLQIVLDCEPSVSIASGHVNNRRYEFYLKDEGDTITEIPIEPYDETQEELWFCECDLTVNYSLIRKEVFQKVRWDDEAKIGEGEHGSWFVDCKRAGFKVAYVPRVNINEQPIRPSDEYRRCRSRANSPSRSCFVRRGIKKYVLGDGTVDYEATSSN